MLIVLLVKFKKRIIRKENGLITKIPILLSLCCTNELAWFIDTPFWCIFRVLLWLLAERHSFKLQKRGSSGSPAAPPSASRQTHAWKSQSSTSKVFCTDKKNYGLWVYLIRQVLLKSLSQGTHLWPSPQRYRDSGLGKKQLTRFSNTKNFRFYPIGSMRARSTGRPQGRALL